MIRGILFDLGGTLDGAGLHWLDRFVALYRALDVTLPTDTLRAAFDAAEARAATDQPIATAGLDAMVAAHVGWQLEHLALDDPPLRRRLIDGFVEPIRAATSANRLLLRDLAGRGFVLGVVSNGCGNVEVLCREYGFTPYLAAVVDSRRAGISKPDPRIFAQGAARIGTAPAATLVVGDSFERDIVPAKRAGMLTAWFQPDASRPVPATTVVDVRLARLEDLAPWLTAAAMRAT